MILWPVALDENGKRVSIDDAHVGGKYTCICCKSPMLARKGEIRTPHFAHKADNSSCLYDNYLHFELEKLLYKRITERDGIAIIHNGKRIVLSDYEKCEKEHRVGRFVPDIYLVVEGIEYFLEICVSNPCSKEKIDSGKLIIEIKPTSYLCLDELKEGNISQGAKCYDLRFYNFPLETQAEKFEIRNSVPEPRIRRSVIAQKFPYDEPVSVHDSSEEDFFMKGTSPEDNSRLKENKLHDSKRGPEVPPMPDHSTGISANPAAKSATVTQWNPNEPIPPVYHYILYSDGSDNIIRADINRVMLRVEPEAILELGVSIADEKFSYEVGRRYAADKGLLPRELLTDIERSFDMAAIKKVLGYQEIPATSRD